MAEKRKAWVHDWIPKDVEPQQVIDMYNEGYSSTDILDKFQINVGADTLLGYLRSKGVYIRPANASGVQTCLECREKFTKKSPSQKVCSTCLPDEAWRSRYRSRGITKPQFDSMYEKQSGLCDLCELPLPEDIKSVFIDHCHKQGHVRALLHSKCNTGLHYIEDDKFLANAVRYIERHRK